MTEVAKDNPAGRLWHLLDRLYQAPDGRNVGQILADTLGAQADDRGELLRRMGDIFDLPGDVREKVGLLDFDGSELIADLASVETALCQLQIDGSVGSWKPHLSPIALSQLKATSSILHQRLPEAVASRRQLRRLTAEIAALITEVRQKDLPDELRLFLLDHLHDMHRALSMVDVVGLVALDQAYERAIGGLIVNDKVRGQAEDAEEAITVWARYGLVLGGLSLLFTTANEGTQLVRSWFPELPASDEVQDGERPAEPGDVVVINGPVDVEVSDEVPG